MHTSRAPTTRLVLRLVLNNDRPGSNVECETNVMKAPVGPLRHCGASLETRPKSNALGGARVSRPATRLAFPPSASAGNSGPGVVNDCAIISRNAGFRNHTDPSPHPSPLGGERVPVGRVRGILHVPKFLRGYVFGIAAAVDDDRGVILQAGQIGRAHV